MPRRKKPTSPDELINWTKETYAKAAEAEELHHSAIGEAVCTLLRRAEPLSETALIRI